MSDIHQASPPGLSAGRAALLAATAGYAALVIYQALTLPDRVPGHVGPTGRVTWWGDRTTHVAVASLVGLGLFLLMWLLPRLLRAVPKEALNMPHKEYWLAPENLPRAQRMLADDMGWLGAATFALIGVAMWDMGRIAQGYDAFGVVFWVVLGVYLVGTLAWSVWSSTGPRWRPPHP